MKRVFLCSASNYDCDFHDCPEAVQCARTPPFNIDLAGDARAWFFSLTSLRGPLNHPSTTPQPPPLATPSVGQGLLPHASLFPSPAGVDRSLPLLQ